MMIDPFLALACTLIAICALACGGSLYRLHRSCPYVRSGAAYDRGLLRFYSGGFDRPLKAAGSLTMGTALMLLLGVAMNGSTTLITVLLVLLSVCGTEWYGAGVDRQKLQALTRSCGKFANRRTA